jgi:hypothetical protein
MVLMGKRRKDGKPSGLVPFNLSIFLLGVFHCLAGDKF